MIAVPAQSHPPVFLEYLPVKAFLPERRVRGRKAEAIRRARKLARKKLQRKGLLPMKPRVISGVRGRGGPRAFLASDPGTSAQLAKSLRPRSAASIEFDVDAASDGVVKREQLDLAQIGKMFKSCPASRRNLDGLRLPAPSPSPRATGAAF